jgi:hypothetical protein
MTSLLCLAPLGTMGPEFHQRPRFLRKHFFLHESPKSKVTGIHVGAHRHACPWGKRTGIALYHRYRVEISCSRLLCATGHLPVYTIVYSSANQPQKAEAKSIDVLGGTHACGMRTPSLQNRAVLKVGLHDAWNPALYRARSEYDHGACVRSDKERASMSMLSADPVSWAKIQNQAVFDFPCSEQDAGACLFCL